MLYVLSFPKFNASILAWIALLPLAVSVLNQPPRRAFFQGWFAGSLAYAGILYWLIPTFRAANVSMILAVACLLMLTAYFGLYWGIWSALLRLGSEFCSLYCVYAAAAWVGLEYLRTYLLSGYPCALFGESQWRHLALIQIASVTGIYGVSFLVVLINVTIAEAVGSLRGVSAAKPANDVAISSSWLGLPRSLRSLAMTAKQNCQQTVLAVTLLLASYLFGFHRLHSYSIAREESRPLHVALLQGNIGEYQKWDSRYVNDIENSYASLNAQAARGKPDLIVWPETALPGYFLTDRLANEWLFQIIRKSGTYHLVGAPYHAFGETYYNSAFSIGPLGQILGQYDKIHLVPFGEIVPWADVLGRWIRVLNALGGFTGGTRSPVLLCAGVPFGITICYEAMFPSLARDSVRRGAAALANLTNDAWYLRTAAPYQHLISNIFRAVENDRWLIRADNTGVTGIINPRGQVEATTPIFVPTLIQGTIYPRHTLTFYTRHGDLFAWICCFLVLLLVGRKISSLRIFKT